MKTTSSPPRSTAPDSELDARFASQLITINKSISNRISAMSSGLVSQFSDMLAKFKVGLTNSSLSVDPQVPGQSVSYIESPSLRHPVSTKYQRLRFQSNGVDPVPSGSGLPLSTGGSLARPIIGADAAHSRDLPSEDCGTAQPPLASAGPRVAFAQPLDSGIAHDPEEEEEDDDDDDDDDDDRESIVESPIEDKTLARLFNFVNDIQLCHALGIVVNWEKSQLVPTQRMVYLGVLLDSISFRASPAQKRVEKLLSIGDVFLSCVEQPVSS